MLLVRNLLRAHNLRKSLSSYSRFFSEQAVPRLAISFTCTVTGCSHRSTHQFTKAAYDKGIGQCYFFRHKIFRKAQIRP